MKYEYYTQRMEPDESIEFKEKLDVMGALGWELVQIINQMAIFKKPVSKKQDKDLLLEETYHHEE